MTTTTTRKPARKSEPAPATGTVKWVEKLKDGFGLLRITAITAKGLVSQEYEVVANVSIFDGKGRGYKLFGEGRCYTVDPDAGACDCPSATIQHKGKPGQCKHCRGLRSALARLFQPVTLAATTAQ